MEQQSEKRYYCIHDWMTKDLGLRGSDLLIYAVIHGYTETRGEFSGSVAYLSVCTGTAKSTVCAALGRLTEKGLLRKRDFVKKGVRYCVYQSSRADGTASVNPIPETERQGYRKSEYPTPESGRGYTENRMGVYRKSDGGIPETGNNTIDNTIDDTITDTIECAAPPPKEPFRKYGEYANVKLTDRELEALKRDYPDDWKQRVDRLSEYMASTGKKYQNHLATIRSWARQDDPKPVKKGLYADLKGGIEL